MGSFPITQCLSPFFCTLVTFFSSHAHHTHTSCFSFGCFEGGRILPIASVPLVAEGHTMASTHAGSANSCGGDDGGSSSPPSASAVLRTLPAGISNAVPCPLPRRRQGGVRPRAGRGPGLPSPPALQMPGNIALSLSNRSKGNRNRSTIRWWKLLILPSKPLPDICRHGKILTMPN